MKTFKKLTKYFLIVFLLFMIFNSIIIFQYACKYSERRSDVAIVLGAGTDNGVLSPVFKERINHVIYLHENNLIEIIIFTGGKGENQTISDSKIAKNYAISLGVPHEDIRIEEKSRYTSENLKEAKSIMVELSFSTALIVSDPIHMKRAMELAISTKIKCEPSPTKTSMYRTTLPKLKFLAYETFFYTLGRLALRY